MSPNVKNPVLISIVVPLYNEELNLPLVHKAVKKVFTKLVGYKYELIFVNDGSLDGSVDTIRQIQAEDSAVQLVDLARNFGKEVATTAGLHHAKGKAAIIIDSDLQHPFELIPEFIAKWEDGADVVVGIKKPSQGTTSWFKRLTSRWFYRIMGVISNSVITPDATDYRLLDRHVIAEFKRFTERNRLTRGLIDWLGFNTEYIEFVPAKRLHGKASYSYLKLFRLSINSIISMSFFPLKIAGWLGVLIVAVSGPLGVFIIIEKYLLHDPWGLGITGTAHLAVILLFLIGIVLICIGLLALYIANIYAEVVNRPLYVERRRPHK